MRGLSRILWPIRNEFNKFNNTRARMLDFIRHMALKVTLKSHLFRKSVVVDVITFFPKVEWFIYLTA